jgi:hypothetical protein
MAGLTALACWGAWSGDDASLTAVKAKLKDLVTPTRAAVIEAATAQLPSERQVDVYSAILMAIAAKAGAEANQGFTDVVGHPIKVTGELTVGDTAHFRAAAKELSDSQLLHAVALCEEMKQGPHDDAQAPIVTFRHEFAKNRYPANPSAQLALLIDQTELPKHLQAPGHMGPTAQGDYYTRLVEVASAAEPVPVVVNEIIRHAEQLRRNYNYRQELGQKLTEVARSGTTLADEVKQEKLWEALGGRPEAWNQIALFNEVPAEQYWRVTQAMVQTAYHHAQKIPLDQTPWQYLSAQLQTKNSDVARECHLAVAKALLQQQGCNNAIFYRLSDALGAQDNPNRRRFNTVIDGVIRTLPAGRPQWGAIYNMVGADLPGLPARIDIQALRAAAEIVGQGPMVQPNSADETDAEHQRYRAFSAALGLAEADVLPNHIATFVVVNQDEFAPQRAQALLQEMAHLVEEGLLLQKAREQVNTALSPTTSTDASVTESRRRIKLHEAALIFAKAKQQVLDPLTLISAPAQGAITQAFAGAIGLPVRDLTAANLGLIGGTNEQQHERVVAVCAAAAKDMLSSRKAVPQLVDADELRFDSSIIIASRLCTDEQLQAARTAIDQVDGTAERRQAAAKAILQAFGPDSDQAAGELVNRIQTALDDRHGDKIVMWRTALHAVLNEVNHRCISPAAAQALLLTDADAFARGGLLSQLLTLRNTAISDATRTVFGAQPIRHLNSTDTSSSSADPKSIRSAAAYLARVVACRQIAGEALQASPWATAGEDPQALAARALIAGNPSVMEAVRASAPVNRATLLAEVKKAVGADITIVARELQALQQAVKDAEISLETRAVGLNHEQLKSICEHLPPNDNARRAFVNALTLAHPDLTVNDLLMAASMPARALTGKLPLPLDAGAREFRAKALAAVVAAQMGDKVGLGQMAAVEQRVAALSDLPADVAPALYARFTQSEDDFNKSHSVTDIIEVLKQDPSSRQVEDAVKAGRELHETAVLGRNLDVPTDKSMRVSAIEAMQQAADSAPTHQQAIVAMFAALYECDALFHRKALDPQKAHQFAKQCLAYVQGKWRFMPTQLSTGPFADLCSSMLTIAPKRRERAKLDDCERLACLRGRLQPETMHIEAVLGAEKVRQRQLRNALWSIQEALRYSSDLSGIEELSHRALRGLYNKGVLRLEDFDAIWQQFIACGGDKESVQAYIDTIMSGGWDFTTLKPGDSALGFLSDKAEPVVVASLSGKARAAEEAIRASIGDNARRVRVVRSPSLLNASRDSSTVKWVERGSDDAVIQVDSGEPGSSDGKITLRADGAVVTHDLGMFKPMLQALLAVHPAGGEFTPTTALMNNGTLLEHALQTLAEISKGTGAKWQISLSQQALNSLSEPSKQQLAQDGVTLKPINSPAPITKPATPTPTPNASPAKTTRPFAKEAADGLAGGAAPNSQTAAAPT